MNELEISPDDVIFIAHSTTQATNALLEGDVANVGVIGLGSGLEGLKAKIDTRIPPIELAPNRFLRAQHEFVSNRNYTSQAIEKIIENFRANGAEVIAVSEAFGVDRTKNEIKSPISPATKDFSRRADTKFRSFTVCEPERERRF